MEWFTLGPKALARLQDASGALRTRLGTARATEQVQAMDADQLADFVNEVLALMDEAESILGRVRSEAPQKKGMPNPHVGDKVAKAKPPREIKSKRKGLPNPFAKRRKALSSSGSDRLMVQK